MAVSVDDTGGVCSRGAEMPGLEELQAGGRSWAVLNSGVGKSCKGE